MKHIDDILKHSTIVFLATSVANACSLLYHLFMVRNLDVVNYGILNSLLAVITIVTISAGTAQMGVAKFVASYCAKDEWGKVKKLATELSKRVLAIAGVVFLLIIICSKPIAQYLKLPSVLPVIIMGSIIFVAIVIPFLLGVLQGLQRFIAFGLNMMLIGGAKLCLGILFIIIGLGAIGALGALMIAGIIATVVMMVLIQKALHAYKADPLIDLKAVYTYFIPIGISQLSIISMTYCNIVLVKHFFSPYEAGAYSVASNAGRIILFLPAAIGLVMFPKSSYRHALDTSSSGVLKKSLIYTALLCTGATAGLVFFPQILIKLFSVTDTAVFIPLSRLFTVSMIFYALLTIIIFHNLATHNLRFLVPLVLFTVLQIGGIMLFHKTLMHVLYIVCISGALVLIAHLFTLRKSG
jgi:O-antigen/teichoic acid export membrane protein